MWFKYNNLLGNYTSWFNQGDQIFKINIRDKKQCEGAKRPSGGMVWGRGCPPPTVRTFGIWIPKLAFYNNWLWFTIQPLSLPQTITIIITLALTITLPLALTLTLHLILILQSTWVVIVLIQWFIIDLTSEREIYACMYEMILWATEYPQSSKPIKILYLHVMLVYSLCFSLLCRLYKLFLSFNLLKTSPEYTWGRGIWEMSIIAKSNCLHWVNIYAMLKWRNDPTWIYRLSPKYDNLTFSINNFRNCELTWIKYALGL